VDGRYPSAFDSPLPDPLPMEAQALPDPVCRFVLQNIDSIAHLEALLLLFNGTETPWERDAVARRLYISTDSASQILERLRSLGLAVDSGANAYRFPDDPALVDHVREVAGFYATHLIAVTAPIHGKAAPSRIGEFAKAFVFRREK
jgi:hypothetical protein